MTPAEEYEAIILRVARSRYTTVDAIKGRCRDRFTFLARQEAAHALAKRGLNTVQIGRYLNRDPSTILNMLGRLSGKRKRHDQALRAGDPAIDQAYPSPAGAHPNT